MTEPRETISPNYPKRQRVLPASGNFNDMDTLERTDLMQKLSHYWAVEIPIDSLFDFLVLAGAQVPHQVPGNLELALVPSTLLKANPQENIRVRHLSCASVEELRLLLMMNNPIEGHIGAWYHMLSASNRKVIGTPLRVDIDHKCTHTAQLCEMCWDTIIRPLTIKVCAKLKELYCGFGARVFAFYTGNRGVHIWVVSPKTNLLSSDARSAVISLLRRTCPEVDPGIFDANVSTGMIHTTRMPFTMHPKSLRLMVPISPIHPEPLDKICFTPGGCMNGLLELTRHLQII